MDITSILKDTGNFLGTYLSQAISFLSLDTPAKIVGVILFLIVGYFVFKLVQHAIKWAIIALIIYLISSLGVSLWA